MATARVLVWLHRDGYTLSATRMGSAAVDEEAIRRAREDKPIRWWIAEVPECGHPQHPEHAAIQEIRRYGW